MKTFRLFVLVTLTSTVAFAQTSMREIPDQVFYTSQGVFTLHQDYWDDMLNQRLELPNNWEIQLFPTGNPDLSRRTSTWATEVFVDLFENDGHVWLVTNKHVWLFGANKDRFHKADTQVYGKIHKADGGASGVYLVSDQDSESKLSGALYLETESGEDWKFARYTGDVRRTVYGARIKVSVATGITVIADDTNRSNTDGLVIHHGDLVPIKSSDF